MKMLFKSLAVATLLAAGATAITPAANAEVVRHTTVVRHRGPVRHCTMRRVRSHGHWVRVRRCS